MLLEMVKGVAQDVRLGAGHAPRESRERGTPIAGLVERGKHQLSYVCLSGRCRTVPPCTAIPFPAREPFFRQPVKHRHHGGVCQSLGKADADFSDRQRRIRPPEYLHDGPLEFAQPVHEVTVPGSRSAVPDGVPSAAIGDFAVWTQP
jgi:hypothetical protein